MNTWEAIDRVLKVVGIVGGLAAAMAVYVQFRDLNSKEDQRKIEDWQSSIVYKIIDDAKSVTFKEISSRYLEEAAKLADNIPKTKLADNELQLVLLKLIQGQSIIVLNSKTYSIKTFIDPQVIAVRNFNIQTENRIRSAKQMIAARQVIAENPQTMTLGQFEGRLVAAGVNSEFVKENFPSLLEQIQFMGLAKVANDSITPLPGTLFPLPLNMIPPSKDNSDLLSKVSDDIFNYLMNSDAESSVNKCFDFNPDAENSVEMRAKILGIIDLVDQESKIYAGQKCKKVATITMTNKGVALKRYIVDMAKFTLMSIPKSR